MENDIIFKGTKDGIIVLLNEELEYEKLKKALEEKSQDAKNFFGGTKTGLVFKGRNITSDELSELTSIVSEKGGLDITFSSDEIYVNKYLKKDEAENDIAKKINKIKNKNMEKDIINTLGEESTLLHKGSLRSGHLIRHSGSVIILGNINQGAEVIATGNIIILGHAKGLVHAGCSGDNNCIVFALNLDPIQLRISSIITYIPKNEKHSKTPSYAYIDEDTIYIKKI